MVRHILETSLGERIERIDPRPAVVAKNGTTTETTLDVVEYADGSYALRTDGFNLYADSRSLEDLWVRNPYNPGRTRGLQLPGGLEVYLKYGA